jgi:hypothetical protein
MSFRTDCYIFSLKMFYTLIVLSALACGSTTKESPGIQSRVLPDKLLSK